MFRFARQLKDSIGAMIFGFILVFAAATLHAWNEYRTVHRSKGLSEARRVIQTIPDANSLVAEMDGRLVHLTGQAETEEVLQDDRFFISAKGIHLARRVRMYQWVEDKETRSNSQNQQKTVYTYRREWVAEPVDSNLFSTPSGHQNPEMPILGHQWTAKRVNVGVYELNKELKDMLEEWAPVTLNPAVVLENVPQDQRENYVVQYNEIFFGKTAPKLSSPQIGDVRVRYEFVAPSVVSLAAQLRGNSLTEYKTSNGEGILTLAVGEVDAQATMDRLDTENSIFAWALRACGTILCVIGCALGIRPLTTLANLVPIIGQLTGGLLIVVAMLVGLSISAVVIGVSWILVRPLLGIAVLALAGLLIALLGPIGRSNVDRLPPIIELHK